MDQPEKQQAIRLVNFIINDVNMQIHDTSVDKQKGKMNVKIEVEMGFDENQNKNYAVNFNIALSRENKSFQLSLKASAIFSTQKPIDDEFKESGFVKINSPAIAFPYVRSFISTLTTNAGINPVILPAYNFSNPDNNK
jgi:preprotein translocase subunit SecB